jgi:hypothetical protein
MACRGFQVPFVFLLLHTALAITPASFSLRGSTQDSAPTNKSKSQAPGKVRASEPALDPGSVKAGVYRNSSFGFSVKVPEGWVLRTEEMNVPAEDEAVKEGRAALDRTAPSASLRAGLGGCPHKGTCAKVLLAAFSRPPEVRAEDVNGSILIAAESAASYPGLTEAAQYFEPVLEVAKAEGFEMDDEPYGFVLGTKRLVRADFQKDVGTRVIRQSTLVLLARGYVLSFTFIGGTEDEVEELVDGLKFGVGAAK